MLICSRLNPTALAILLLRADELTQSGVVPVMYWTCWQRRHAYVSFLRNTPGGRLGFIFSSSRWLGVRASGLFASSDDFVIGRLVTTTLISYRNICRQSSLRELFWKSPRNGRISSVRTNSSKLVFWDISFPYLI